MARGDSGNDYETEREARISRNFEKLKGLVTERNINKAMVSVVASHGGDAKENASKWRPGRRRMSYGRRRGRVLAPVTRSLRKSSRLRGVDPGAEVFADDRESGSQAEEPKLLELEEYFKEHGMEVDPIRSDGHFTGWVNEEVCERYGIAGDPDRAWNENGGGQFSFKIKKSDIPSHLRGRGWSDARAFSSTLLLKNPNAYFYRHVAPHETQSMGEWTEEEHNLFLEIARTFGVGTKWGLFASHIPKRVGYQCSAYYREVIIPQGLVFDPKFKLTHGGKAVYVGC
ncbi:Myb-like domain-containing protein [Chloropicon primus]|uniref:Myb-like domain-containing protein n=1 Tax=Chloropicon primus TaxID=1764295 RepID=A0A5B8MKC2_9CHLO|nr:hypothetical protein A3770_03p26630 [Chloropicon primus]UPQ99357.1 Myb-like domain-containing protein [Chloropicon primus]|mmetsp:Transcript_8830/g.25200  ORF Transcript_8830/g.25200 Transcript_8830/m.25200 type:complete len:285 (-) Transcript_8830:79-933(-)|eukprot:QDZ20145.1 hypothetical protein A3770_03p26630 [Chloropicon primus]